MIVKNLDNSHLPQIVALHEMAFKGFFLTELGPSFLKRYYSSVVKNMNAIKIGVFDENNQLVGFAVTAKKSLGFNKSMIKDSFFSFFFEGLKILISRPTAIYRILKNLDKKSHDAKNDKGEYSELLSIATHPNKQGLGIGKLLLAETEKILKKEGLSVLALTTDFFNNDAVIRFYEKSGYTIYYDFETYPKRKMFKLIKNI